ncbi:multidrug resistance-associated ABC transporter [Trametopsis cervina]|nr:multidrug resistance-associated ABC transporter [Trametopsis cervina]
MGGLCEGSSPLDVSSTCIRLSWSALAPLSIVATMLLLAIPRPRPIARVVEILKSPVRPFLTLPEAEALLAQEGKVDTQKILVHPPLWRMFVLAFIGILGTVLWTVLGSYLVFAETSGVWRDCMPYLVAASWLYACCRPIVKPTATVPNDLLILYISRLLTDTLVSGGMLYDHGVYGSPFPKGAVFAAFIWNLVADMISLVTIFTMPLDIPSSSVDCTEIGKSVSPEDYASLWDWVSFHWVHPLIALGTNTTLQESDVWDLSPTLRAQPVYIRFSAVRRTTLLRRLWATNASDLIVEFILTYISIIFKYLGPFFLKRILDSLDAREDETEEERVIRILPAYIYTFLALLVTLAQAESDVQHLWYSRRVAARVRTILMTATYDKALKRKDFSGVADKAAARTDGAPRGADLKADDTKGAASTGKIMNLMAADTNRVSQVIPGLYFLYGAPLEIIVATTFLCQLLGPSALAGFIVLVIFWPLNDFVARRAVRVHKGLSNARDKRMSVLSELITAVKFIKFFAWEDRWIQRALDAREVELQWLAKARLNSIGFSFLWTSAPIVASIVTFFTYVTQGHQLTIGTAFPAIALFGMLRAPLNNIPTWVVEILQSGIALNRISTYLDEDEVDERISTLKKPSDTSTVEDIASGLGISEGTLKWNEVEEGPKDTAELSSQLSSEDASDLTAIDNVSNADPDQQERRFRLAEISVVFPEGKLTVITGPTASGKTALLMALLGEMTMLEGRLILSKNPSYIDEHGLQHSISYAAQSPWLRYQSIKDNILFGHPYDEERYNAVVECCALLPDLHILEDGDNTEIGARGVSLSGGQKARQFSVALARAIYAPTKYVLLDDPLSAVDSHTARFLFERLLQGPLLEHRTVILVTHHVELVLPGTFYLVRMLDGRIDAQGTLTDLRARGILEEITHDESAEAHKPDQRAEAVASADVAASKGEALGEAVPADGVKKPRKLIEEEKREEGSVKWDIYKTYLKASSYWTWAILVLLIAFNQGLAVGEKVWIKIWGEAYGNSTAGYADALSFRNPLSSEYEVPTDHLLAPMRYAVSNPGLLNKGTSGVDWPRAQEHPHFYIGVYAAISMGVATLNVLSAVIHFSKALKASRKLFQQLLDRVVRATMRWHDITPQGRMLNRFSKDVETVDSSLSATLQSVNSSLANMAASVVTIVVVFPLFIFPAAAIGFVYHRISIGYLNTGRDLRRMESNTRSPIFANFGEVLEGIVTVRAFSAERRFLNDHCTKIDLTTKMWHNYWQTNRWLMLQFDAIGAVAVAITTLFALAGYVSEGLAGVCITSAMSFTGSVYWACRSWTLLELNLNSVERIVEYLDLPQEPSADTGVNRPPAYWPSSSSPNSDNLISVEKLVIKYAPELPTILHGISFQLKARQRIGLLGRTGSGKSTLAMSILRFVDPVSGRIVIDGIDIANINIHDLRSRIVIFQDATLFSGTLRDNLDPFGEHEDSECLDALYRVHMLDDRREGVSQDTSKNVSRAASRVGSIHEEEGGSSATASNVSLKTSGTDTRFTITLDTQVSPGGTNFSQGQRQLIAMARALLRRNSIIIMDEATSSIDFATDAKIQHTIREEFSGSLLLTVAHRLQTIIDYDRLIILDKGQLVEFDTPYNLIQKEGGTFRDMCLKSGTFAELEAAARAKAESH